MVPVAASIGGQTDAYTDPSRLSTPVSASACPASRSASAKLSSGASSTSNVPYGSETMRPPRSHTAARTWRSPKSRPAAFAALGATYQ